MDTQVRDLVTSYVQAVSEHRWDAFRALIDPDAEFTLGDNTLKGADAFVGGFLRLAPIILRNDIRKVFVDGNDACVIYDFVTDTPAGAVISIEYLKVKEGRIASSLLVFERLHWTEALAVLKERTERQAATVSA